jgi:hypothetical protein
MFSYDLFYEKKKKNYYVQIILDITSTLMFRNVYDVCMKFHIPNYSGSLSLPSNQSERNCCCILAPNVVSVICQDFHSRYFSVGYFGF